MIEKNTARLSGVLLALLAICGCFWDVDGFSEEYCEATHCMR